MSGQPEVVVEEKDAAAVGEELPEEPGADAHSLWPSRREVKKNACTRFCECFMKIVAADAIYGSFVGPHPTSFFWCCCICRGCCCQSCLRPFAVSSIATKTMYFIMLTLVTILACFFIIPWPDTFLTHQSTTIAAFWPCSGKMIRNKEHNGGCETHAGHFMVYRCFFAFGTLMLTNSLLMTCVKSTKKDPYRAKIHQGFWFYKYLYLFGLLLMYFLFLDGRTDPLGIFELICSIIGNIFHMVFSGIELAYMLDVVELWVAENRSSESMWADFKYWTFTLVIVILDILLFGLIITDFSHKQKFTLPDIKWPFDNCITGEKYEIDWLHVALILSVVAVILILIVVVLLEKRNFKQRFPYTGWLQVSLIALFNICFLWSALFSSAHIHSRPRCNWAIEILKHGVHVSNKSDPNDHHNIQAGSHDIYFRTSGLFHGILAVLALLYFTFVHGPRADTAPLTVGYFCFFPDDSHVPVFPDKSDSPEEFVEAVEKREVWDDEKDEVAYSWSLFYFMMMCGGLSLMMALTNFTNPWGRDRYNSSMVALGCKFASSILATFMYIFILLVPCSSISPEEHLQHKRRFSKSPNKQKLRRLEEGMQGMSDEENAMSAPAIDSAAVAVEGEVTPVGLSADGLNSGKT